MKNLKHFVLTRTMTVYIEATSLLAAKKIAKETDLIDEADCVDLLVCEETGEEVFL